MFFRSKKNVNKLDDYTLEINGNEVSFPSKISNILENKEKIIVLISGYKDHIKERFDCTRNIFCYDKDGAFIWQIEPPTLGRKGSGYLSIMYNKELDKVFAFSWVRYDLDIETGKISNPEDLR